MEKKKISVNWRWVEDGSVHGKRDVKESHGEILSKLKCDNILSNY